MYLLYLRLRYFGNGYQIWQVSFCNKMYWNMLQNIFQFEIKYIALLCIAELQHSKRCTVTQDECDIFTCHEPARFSISSIRMVTRTTEGSNSVCTWSWIVAIVYTADALIDIYKRWKRKVVRLVLVTFCLFVYFVLCLFFCVFLFLKWGITLGIGKWNK